MNSRFNKRIRQIPSFWWVQAAVLCGCCSSFLAPSLLAQAPARFPVPAEQVLEAMRERDWPLKGIEIRLATSVTARVVNPVLEIVSVSPTPRHEALLRVRCRLRTECIPFLAWAVWPADTPIPSLPAASETAAAGGRTETHAGDPALAARPLDSADASASSVIHAGTSATLLLEGAHIRIQLPVIFAQDGHVGDSVRVTTPNRKQTYVAEVLTPQLLKGEF